MPTINVSGRVADLLRGLSEGGEYKQTGTRRQDGSWDIPIGEDTLERIQEHAQPGETESDTILRIISTSKGAN